MAGQSRKTQSVTLRVPIKDLATIDTYATANDVSRAAAMIHFMRAGMAAETGEQAATKADLVAFAATITKAIENQPVQVQQLPALESAEKQAPRRLTLKERLSGWMNDSEPI